MSKLRFARLRIVFSLLLPAAVLGLLLTATPPAWSQTETVIYSFTGGADGANPVFGTLVRDAKGNLFGTTVQGGAAGNGTVFQITPTGTEKVLYSFAGGTDGANPTAGLLRAKGNLFGTTVYGGTFGAGTVFEIPKKGAEKVLYSFSGIPDGVGPYGATLVADKQGNLYGTTNWGGVANYGTVFEVTPTGTEKTLYAFAGTPDGWAPVAGLVRDSKGNLYGVSYYGGPYGDAYGFGSVYEITAAGTEKVLYNFCPSGSSCTDGANPYAATLVRDTKGNLYGTTEWGGAFNAGTVFEITKAGAEKVLYSFNGPPDGWQPFAGLVRDTAGNLYGTTAFGGAYGYGTVFKIAPSGTETVLYNFTGGADGANPWAGLVRDKQGNLYGTTAYGGNINCSGGCGVVFKVTP